MLLGDFLNTLAAQSGISADSPELKAILSSPTLSAVDLPDSIVAKIQSAHLTLDAAKNNPAVLSHIKAQLYNGVDSELQNTLTEMGVLDTFKSDFETEKSTPKRISLALKKIAALEKEKSGAAKGDKAELQKEIDRLNASVVEVKRGFEAEKATLVASHQNEILDYDLNTQLAGYNYALPKEMATDLKIQTAKMLINKALKDGDAKLIRENGALKLKRVSQDIDYFDSSNQKVEPKKFFDGVLAQNNLLAVATPAGQTKETFMTTGQGTQPLMSKSWDAAISTAQSQLTTS